MESLHIHRELEGLELVQRDRLVIDRPGWASLSCTAALVGADCVAFLAALLLFAAVRALIVYEIAANSAHFEPSSLRPALVLILGILLYLAMKGRYTERRPFWTDTQLLMSTAIRALIIETGLWATGYHPFDWTGNTAMLSLFFLCAAVAGPLTKAVLDKLGLWNIPIVLVGVGESAASVEAALATDRSLGYEIVGRVDPVLIMAGSSVPRFQQLLDRYSGQRLLLALDGDQAFQLRVIESALRQKVPFSITPPRCAYPACASETTHLFSQDAVLLSVQHGFSRYLPQMAKTAMDLTLAFLLLAVLSPLFLVLTVLCSLDGGAPFFLHRRVGRGGRTFFCRKFRTMVCDADRVLAEHLAADPQLAAEWSETRKLVRDPRVTAIGRFLRATSLDELPQLINVLKLEMSLVGPRPIVQSEIVFYGEDIEHYYAARPGLTGLWQVSGRSGTSYTRRVRLDVWYVNNWTIWLDTAILLKTIPAVLTRNGAV